MNTALMKQNRFDDCLVWITPRSPFARRVRLAFLEAGLNFREQACDIFHPSAELLGLNPVARVPIVQLKTGEVLIESHLILQSFYEHTESPLRWDSPEEKLAGLFWSGAATGLAEKVVEFYLDTLRPQNIRDSELAEELSAMIARIFGRLDKQLASGPKDWICGKRMTQADLDMGSALTYLCLRYTSEWKNRYQHVAAYLGRLEERPSFQKTVPPAAT